MQKVLTSDEMREVDRQTTEQYGIPSLLLMENAAHAAARVISQRLDGSVDGASVLVFCGKGNNGGDGAALARVLWTQGANVEVCLIGLVSGTNGDARTNFEILRKIADRESFEVDQADIALEEISSLEEWMEYDSFNFQSDDPDVIVDALFGIGLTHPLEGVYAEVAAFIHSYGVEEDGPLVVALDIPSGLCANTGKVDGIVPCADVTVTFTAAKPANILPPASRYNGDLAVAEIGSPCEIVNQVSSQLYLVTKDDARRWLAATEFAPDSYKFQRGHALLIAGSADYSGAAVLCGDAAIRSGVGLATIACPESSRQAVIGRVQPEVMVRGLPETKKGAISAEAFDEIQHFAERKITAVAIGSGMSHDEETTRDLVRKVVENRTTPIVIDADGLNALAPFDLAGSEDLPIILTPHLGEFKRLLGMENDIDDVVATVRDFAQLHRVYVVLKGERPMIAEPSGCVAVSPTGNSGLGKAGNGDTLTGLVVGFVAQAAALGIGMFETLAAVVYIAGLAGDVADERYGKRVMTASDVRECFHAALTLVAEQE
jgi:ADP-dependent NAD(P)H-hydrate dehydratase / NAD(P)H-hydrate epimerase